MVLSARGVATSQLTNPFMMNIGIETAVTIKLGNFELAVASRKVLPKMKMKPKMMNTLTPPPNMPAQPIKAAVPDEATVAKARTLAESANSLAELQEALRGFEGCNLKFTARSTVFADGNPDARLMIVGEAPGRDEDAQGLPFVGRSGQLLDKMLAAIGLDRTQVYITNVLPWRPPGNRTPTPMEIEICRPFLERHIALAAPEILLTAGNVPTKTLLKTTSGILSMRGKWKELSLGANTYPLLPTLHPSYLLRQPPAKRQAWHDLLALKKRLEEKSDSP